MQVRVLESARREISAALLWWKANRPAAPGLLEQELSDALLKIQAHPRSGPKARGAALAKVGLRRVSLVQTRYYVYYRIDEKRQQVRVHHVWHMSRRAPKSP